MLSVAVHKDIGEYKPKFVGKLTVRTLIAIAGAIGGVLLLSAYCFFVLGISIADNIWMIWIVAIPFWAAGFWQPHKMDPEKFVALWLRHNLSSGQMKYIPTPRSSGYMKNIERGAYNDSYKNFAKVKGIENYSPRNGRVAEC